MAPFRTTAATVLASILLSASASHADEPPWDASEPLPVPAMQPLPPPPHDAPPNYPLPVPAKPKVVWYGMQILIPGLVADTVFATGIGLLFASIANDEYPSGPALLESSLSLMIIGGVVHGLSGPIVHLANGQPLKAGLSFLVEGVVPSAVITAGIFTRSETAQIALLGAALPITWVAGMAFDTAFLARKKAKPEPEKGSAISFAPLVVPKLHANSGTPVGLSLVGRF